MLRHRLAVQQHNDLLRFLKHDYYRYHHNWLCGFHGVVLTQRQTMSDPHLRHHLVTGRMQHHPINVVTGRLDVVQNQCRQQRQLVLHVLWEYSMQWHFHRCNKTPFIASHREINDLILTYQSLPLFPIMSGPHHTGVYPITKQGCTCSSTSCTVANLYYGTQLPTFSASTFVMTATIYAGTGCSGTPTQYSYTLNSASCVTTGCTASSSTSQGGAYSFTVDCTTTRSPSPQPTIANTKPIATTTMVYAKSTLRCASSPFVSFSLFSFSFFFFFFSFYAVAVTAGFR